MTKSSKDLVPIKAINTSTLGGAQSMKRLIDAGYQGCVHTE